jgi:hypothetical protein
MFIAKTVPSPARTLIAGYEGILVGILIFPLMWWAISLRTPKDATVDFGKAFDKLLTMYLDIAKFILGLAAGGIVGVVSLRNGSAMIAFAAPLFLLATSIFYGALFMPFLTLNYEWARDHHKKYQRWQFIRNRALGFSALACFCTGYAWLIVAAINNSGVIGTSALPAP